ASGLMQSFTGFVVSRALVGFFASGVLPAAVQTIASWLPSKVRGITIGGLILLSSTIVVGVRPASSYLTEALSWQRALLVMAAPLMLWIVPVVLFAVLGGKPSDGPMNAGFRALGSGRSWAFILGAALSAPAYRVMSAKVSRYLSDDFGMDTLETRLLFGAFGVLGGLGALAGGFASDALLGGGARPITARLHLLRVSG
ncbi:MAG: MFS transporter, partial [bacterium]|nr:MFS transporter [bacterium]